MIDGWIVEYDKGVTVDVAVGPVGEDQEDLLEDDPLAIVQVDRKADCLDGDQHNAASAEGKNGQEPRQRGARQPEHGYGGSVALCGPAGFNAAAVHGSTSAFRLA